MVDEDVDEADVVVVETMVDEEAVEVFHPQHTRRQAEVFHHQLMVSHRQHNSRQAQRHTPTRRSITTTTTCVTRVDSMSPSGIQV